MDNICWQMLKVKLLSLCLELIINTGVREKIRIFNSIRSSAKLFCMVDNKFWKHMLGNYSIWRILIKPDKQCCEMRKLNDSARHQSIKYAQRPWKNCQGIAQIIIIIKFMITTCLIFITYQKFLSTN